MDWTGIAIVLGVCLAMFLVIEIVGRIHFAATTPKHLRQRRRKEMLLMFSPGEWVWFTGSMAVMAALLLWTLR